MKTWGWLVLLAWASLTVLRLPAWESDVTLWRAATRTAPDSVRAWMNRRAAAMAIQDWPDAVEACVRLRSLTAVRPFEHRLIEQGCGPF